MSKMNINMPNNLFYSERKTLLWHVRKSSIDLAMTLVYKFDIDWYR